MSTYPSKDKTFLYVTLSKTLQDINKRKYGVAAIDIDTSFLPSLLNANTIEGVQDFFLVNTPENYILYGEKKGKPNNLLSDRESSH